MDGIAPNTMTPQRQQLLRSLWCPAAAHVAEHVGIGCRVGARSRSAVGRKSGAVNREVSHASWDAGVGVVALAVTPSVAPPHGEMRPTHTMRKSV